MNKRRRYVFDIRNHVMPPDDWEDADAMVAMLTKAKNDGVRISLTDGQTTRTIPESVVNFLIDGLLHMCADESISMVVLAERGRITIQDVAGMLGYCDRAVDRAFRDRGLAEARLTNYTKPAHYDRGPVLEAMKEPLFNLR